MKFRSSLLLLLVVAVLAPDAWAAGTCKCTMSWKVWHSGYTLGDYLCMFLSTSSGPYETTETYFVEHDMSGPYVYSRNLFSSRWDRRVEIAAGDEEDACTKAGDFRTRVREVLVSRCNRNGGSDCASRSMYCEYKQ